MAITISDHILQLANMSESEFRLEVGLFLFERGILTMGKASEFVGISQYEFQLEISNRGLTISYDEEEFEKDLQLIRKKYPKN